MLERVNGMKIEFPVRTPKENEVVCDMCHGTGWLINKEKAYFTQCNNCNHGVLNVCKECGDISKNTMCWKLACRKKREYENEIIRKEKAKKYTLENCPKESCEMFYSECYDYDEGYDSNLDWIDSLDEEDKPSYVWGTSRVKFSLDAYDIISNAIEDSFEDAFDRVDELALNKLQIACDEFVKAHDGRLDVYYVDYDVCIEL